MATQINVGDKLIDHPVNKLGQLEGVSVGINLHALELAWVELVDLPLDKLYEGTSEIFESFCRDGKNRREFIPYSEEDIPENERLGCVKELQFNLLEESWKRGKTARETMLVVGRKIPELNAPPWMSLLAKLGSRYDAVAAGLENKVRRYNRILNVEVPYLEGNVALLNWFYVNHFTGQKIRGIDDCDEYYTEGSVVGMDSLWGEDETGYFQFGFTADVCEVLRSFERYSGEKLNYDFRSDGLYVDDKKVGYFCRPKMPTAECLRENLRRRRTSRGNLENLLSFEEGRNLDIIPTLRESRRAVAGNCNREIPPVYFKEDFEAGGKLLIRGGTVWGLDSSPVALYLPDSGIRGWFRFLVERFRLALHGSDALLEEIEHAEQETRKANAAAKKEREARIKAERTRQDAIGESARVFAHEMKGKIAAIIALLIGISGSGKQDVDAMLGSSSLELISISLKGKDKIVEETFEGLLKSFDDPSLYAGDCKIYEQIRSVCEIIEKRAEEYVKFGECINTVDDIEWTKKRIGLALKILGDAESALKPYIFFLNADRKALKEIGKSISLDAVVEDIVAGLDDSDSVLSELKKRSGISPKRINFSFSRGALPKGMDDNIVYGLSPDLLRSCIGYLMKNSDEARGEQPLRIDVRTFYELCEGEKYCGLVFEDNGVGMSEETRARLLGSMEQLTNTRSSKDQGQFVGVFSVRRACELYGGYLDIESQKDVGTRMILRFKQEPFSETEMRKHRPSMYDM